MNYDLALYILVPVTALLLGYAIGYRRGNKKGLEEAEALGGHCDVCQKLSAKVLVFRQQLICIKCYQAIMSNKEMKCRLCDKPIENCECV